MSKKKIFTLTCLFIFISWSLFSLYYYNKHIVTIQEYKVGERIEVSEGIVIINSIEVHDFQRDYLDYDEWFYKILQRLPVRLQRFAMKVMAFYTEPYTFDLGANGIEGRIMYVYGIYVSNENKSMFYKDSLRINAYAAAENGSYLAGTGSGYVAGDGRNYILFHSSGKFFLNEYSPDSNDKLIINVKDTLSNENYELNLAPTWETNKYNFFNRPPADYSFSPDIAVSKFIRAAIYKEDLRTAKGLIGPQASDLLWEKLDHDKWSGTQGRVTQYIGSYLGYRDVFSTTITFEEFDKSEDILEQRILLNYNNGEWKIIDVSSLKAISDS
ncbi:MAG: hypothetical protein SCK29_05620 [Bacillota bacterium]|nr:hypothetical protein [Bacillota bacterium]MDW7683583.1 hypothetical protein [Bacillota bacterium]